MSIAKSGESKLRQIFHSMAYDDKGVRNLESIKKWLESQQNKLSASLKTVGLQDGSPGKVVHLKQVSQALGTVVKVKLVNLEGISKKVQGSVVEPIKLSSEVQADRKSKFQNLLKSKAKDLAQLEAYAANVPAWVVTIQDEPKWLQSVESDLSGELRKQLEAGASQIILRLGASYSLKDVVAVLSAAVQVDGFVLLLLTPEDVESSIEKLLPALYLIDSINKAAIRNQPLEVIPVAPGFELLPTLTSLDKSLSHGKSTEVIEIGDISIMSHGTKAAELKDLGRSVHYVVNSSADITSAVSSISKNTWFAGVSINHRCRSIAFVHQPVYNQVITELQAKVKNITVGSSDSSDRDFFERKVDVNSVTLSSISKLGAKVIANQPDYSGPTVVYDIGTSSDLVALKDMALGHILVLIPYRSQAELVSLANNFGVPDQVIIYSNCVSTTMDITRKLNASEILVNAATPTVGQQRSSPLDVSWQVISKDGSTLRDPSSEGSNTVSKPSLNSSKWRELSFGCKVEKLGGLVDSVVLNKLLSLYLDTTQGSPMTLPKRNDNTTSAALILTDPKNSTASSVLVPLVACLLRDKPVLVISHGTKLPAEITQKIKENLPTGLVSVVEVNSPRNITSLASDLELVWILQGEAIGLDRKIFPNGTENKIVLVNKVTDEEVLHNAKIAIGSAFKNCYL